MSHQSRRHNKTWVLHNPLHMQQKSLTIIRQFCPSWADWNKIWLKKVVNGTPGRAKYDFFKKIVSIFNMYCMCSKNRNKKINWIEKFNLPYEKDDVPHHASSDAILNNYQKITFSKKMYAANRQMVTLWLIMGCPILIKDLIISRVSVVKNNLLGTFFHYQ